MRLKVLIFFSLLVPIAFALTVDQNKVCFPYAGGTTSSSSFQTRVSVEQGFVGRGTSPGFATELGCIYGFENTHPTVHEIRICDGTCALGFVMALVLLLRPIRLIILGLLWRLL